MFADASHVSFADLSAAGTGLVACEVDAAGLAADASGALTCVFVSVATGIVEFSTTVEAAGWLKSLCADVAEAAGFTACDADVVAEDT